MRSRHVALVFALTVMGCAAASGIRNVAELSGEWRGRVSNPAGNAAAALTVTPTGAYQGTMYLDGADRAFHGSLIVVRAGEVRYQGTDGNGAVQITDEAGHRTLRFLRDDGRIEAVFRR